VSETYLDVRPDGDVAEAEFALRDIVTMVQSVAAKRGVSLAPATPSASGAQQFCVLKGAELLRSEVGRHRVQFVPKSSRDGRVSTAVVLVSLWDGERGEQDAPPPIVKTYNYIVDQVTRHATGAVGSITKALSGEV